jgi:hypothetical protein
VSNPTDEKRNAAIRKMRQDGVPVTEIAHRFTITSQRVYQLTKEPSKPGTFKHGTPSAYSNHKCRCPDCTRAWAKDCRKRRNSTPERIESHIRRNRAYYFTHRDRIRKQENAKARAKRAAAKP